jgi:iron complex transport system ATP-binding protein
MPNDALVLKGVTAGYGPKEGPSNRAREPELREVTLHLSPGEILCVLGPNGAGKSTLVRVASGLLEPWSGEVRLLGTPLRDCSRLQIAKELAVVEQLHELRGDFSVRQVVMMGRSPHQDSWMRPTERDEERVEQALDRCELRLLASRPARALSGGEQKRVAIARALAQEPKVLLLDEPGAFLDVRHQLDVYELLSIEARERGVACLVVMHDLNIAAQFADRVALMKSGRILASGPIAEVMTWRTLKETFDTDLYCGVNDLTGARFFLPMRSHGA